MLRAVPRTTLDRDRDRAGAVVRSAGWFTESHAGLYMTLFGVAFALGAPIFLGPSHLLLKVAGGAAAGVALGWALDREQTPSGGGA